MPLTRESLVFRILNLYPPFLGAGISVAHRDGDQHTIHVRMKLRFYNRNLFGTHFGGSLYSMCDPFFVFLLLRNLGPGYLVWDKAAKVEFKKPGRGTVRAIFHVPPESVEDIRRRADAGEKVEPVFVVEVKSEADGEVVARIEKTLWVKRKETAPHAG